ncbi:MAG TPA: PA2169 family four-helix-bundle protein [Chitinophagaceae bacterium]|nr:PA2169 family four-helix-bundle protein [Chitinophagaceae bacterium]
MEKNEKVTEVLNDLIRINHDRIEGYERAAKETKSEDADLRTLFTEMANESRRYANDLSRHVANAGGDPAEGATAPGKIYRAWMDVKAAFTGKDRKAILASCEFGEDAAQRAYDAALASDVDLPTDLRQVIVDEKNRLRQSHDRIKELRDRHP